MISDYLELRKQIEVIVSKLLSKEFDYDDKANDFSSPAKSLNALKENRDKAIELFFKLNEEEMISTIGYLINNVLSDRHFVLDLFRLSVLQFLIYEMCLYIISTLLIMDKYKMVHSILFKDYFFNNGHTIQLVSFYYALGLRGEHICNLRKLTNCYEDEKSVAQLISSRLNTSFATLAELKSTDLIISDCAALSNDTFYPYIHYVNDNPIIVSIIGNKIKNNDKDIFLLFGVKDKGELLNKVKDLSIHQKLIGIGNYL